MTGGAAGAVRHGDEGRPQRLELAQRVRSVAWYVLLVVVGLVVGGVIVVLFLSLAGYQRDLGGAIFSTTIFLVMLVTSLVTPALSGNAINGDRDGGTLAALAAGRDPGADGLVLL